jgi:Kef-type K+ transport system membrane component KefB
LFILAISIIGKLLGGFIGAIMIQTNKALAVGFGMNARGSRKSFSVCICRQNY